MLLRSLIALIGGASVVATAWADVPTQDAARNVQEKSIADCMTKARSYKDAAKQPSQGIKTSVATPGPSQVPGAGSDIVSGAGVTAPTSGMVSNIDFSEVPMVAPGGGASVAALNLNTVAQAVSALSAITNAIKSNNSNTTAASAMMGALDLTQLAWNQNSGARINNGAMWNQLIMTATMTAQLFNQRGLNLTSGASSGANALTFDPRKATFIGASPSLNTNAVVVPLQ